ncbi:hypothetical protein ABIC03_007875 [Bradyrhizobium sp. RT6a]
MSIALGREAILAGYTVQFKTATTLVAGLANAHGERRLDEKLLALSKPKLLILDELGCVTQRGRFRMAFDRPASVNLPRLASKIELNAQAGENLRLPVERQVISALETSTWAIVASVAIRPRLRTRKSQRPPLGCGRNIGQLHDFHRESKMLSSRRRAAAGRENSVPVIAFAPRLLGIRDGGLRCIHGRAIG